VDSMTTADSNPWEHFPAQQDPEIRALSEAPPSEDDMPVGDRIVTRAEFIAVLEEQVSTASDGGSRPIRHDREGAGMLAAAWRLIILGEAYAVLTLLHAGFEVEPQANARVCLEHAVALRELALAADDEKLEAAMEQLARDAGHFQKRQLGYLDQIDADTGGTNRSLPPAGNTSPGCSRRNIKADRSKISSRACHPAVPYIAPTAG
jgi:hypothetical protein